MKRLIYALIVLGLLGAIAFGLSQSLKPTWPEFSSTESSEPQVIMNTVGRDYAYHTGDLIEVDLYVRQQPGTEVNPFSFTIDGDFELAQKPEISQKRQEDGSVVYRFPLKVQCFIPKEKLELKGAISWRIGEEERQELTLEPLHIGWSNTYDGRSKLMEGEDPTIPVYWYATRFGLPLAIGSLIYLTFLTLAIRKWCLRPRQPAVDPKKTRAITLLKQVKDGKCSRDEYQELDTLLREHLGYSGSTPASELMQTYGCNPMTAEFFQLNAVAIYGDEDSIEESRDRLVSLGNQILSGWPDKKKRRKRK